VAGISEPMPVAATFEFRNENGISRGDLAFLDTMVTIADAKAFLADYASTDSSEQRGKHGVRGDVRHGVDLRKDLFGLHRGVGEIFGEAEMALRDHRDRRIWHLYVDALLTGLRIGRHQDDTTRVVSRQRVQHDQAGAWHHDAGCVLDLALEIGVLAEADRSALRPAP
jgi:hypothetical protein